jgi:hypothetical protein
VRDRAARCSLQRELPSRRRCALHRADESGSDVPRYFM